MKKEKDDKLFDQFPPVTTREWMDKINADLKGADFNRKLVWKTSEGFEVKPFYRREDIENLHFINSLPGEFPYLRGSKTRDNNWLVRQNIYVTDYATANRKALTILMKGIDSLGFIISDPESVNKENFDVLLNDIQIESVEINFLCNGRAKEILDFIIRIITERGLENSKIHGAIETDPIGRLMVNGALCVPPETGFDYLASLTDSASALPNLRTIHINAGHFSNAGADAVQELAFGLSSGSEYIAQLTERGITADTAASKIRFSFGTGPGYFMEIAKLRAARLLWSLVLEGFIKGKSEELKMNIHCITCRWNKTIYDPYVNMLRTQTEAMSAIIGGTDSLTVEPFDAVFRKPDEFSERIARNQQLILKEEAYFGKVADPSAGSYYIESLTNLIADNAWKLFIRLEENGGFLESLRAGVIQKEISLSAEKRKNDTAIRKISLLGTNRFPNNNESVLSSVDQAIAFSKTKNSNDFTVDPVVLFRASEEYERLRMAVEKTGRRPVVFLLPLGNIAMRKARSQFSSDFFGCAGYKIIDSDGFETVEKGVDAALASEADIVVICSSDDEYPLYVPDIYSRLNGSTIIVVAGNPSCSEELKSKGIEFFIHLRSDVTETLNYFNIRLGIGR